MQRTIVTCALVFFFLLPGCDQGEGANEVKRVRPAVDLPDTPTLTIPQHTVLNQDGSYTVAGLLNSAEEHFGKGVRVTGIVLEKHTCKDAKEGTLCPPPYLLLVDSAERPANQLMVVGTEQRLSDSQEGESETVSGRFQQWSADKFYVRSEGLVEIPEEDEEPQD